MINVTTGGNPAAGVGGNANPDPAGNNPAPPTGPGALGGGAGDPFFDEFQDLLNQLGWAPGGADEDPLVDDNGAPWLDEPPELAALDTGKGLMMSRMMQIMLETYESQGVNARDSVRNEGARLEKQHEKQMKRFEEWVDKCRDAARKAKHAKNLGLVAKICAFVGSVVAFTGAAVATAATGGAAAPLLVMSGMALVGSSMALGSEISRRHGGDDLNLVAEFEKVGEMMAKEFGCGNPKLLAGLLLLATGGTAAAVDPSLYALLGEGLAIAAGADEDSQAVRDAGLAFTIIAAVGVMVAGIAAGAGSGANVVAANADRMTKLMKLVPQIMQSLTQMGTGATSTAQSVATFEATDAEVEAQRTQAMREEGQAVRIGITHDMERAREWIEQFFSAVQELLTRFAEFNQEDQHVKKELIGRMRSTA